MESLDHRNDRAHLLRWIGWLVLANTFLLLLASIRYWPAMGQPETPMAWLFFVVAFPGHLLTLAMAPAAVLALLALARPRRWLVMAAAVPLFGLLLVGLAIDAIVFSLYRFHLNGMVWSLIRNGGLTEILPLSTSTWAVAFVLLGGAFGLEAGVATLLWRWIKRPNRHGKWVAAVAVALLAAEHSIHIWADAAHYTPVTKHVRILPGHTPFSAKRRLIKWGWIKPETDSGLSIPAGRSHLDYPLEPLNCHPTAPPMNILLIVLDGWRFDMLTEAATPNISGLAQRSMVFEKHSAAANSTRFGVFALFYGLYGTYWHSMLGEERGPVLINQLNKAGYQFGVFATAPLTSPEFDRTVFSEIRRRIPLKTEGPTTPERDRAITRRFLEFMDRRDPARPFFGFLFYDSTHAYDYPPGDPAPFQPACERVEHLKLNNNYDPIPIKNRFLNAVHFVDSEVGQVLRRLGQDSLLDQTVVVVTGDHGQEFNENHRNNWGHNSNFSRYQNQVPFVLHWPGKSAAHFAHLTSHLDLAPTLLQQVLGCTNAPASFSNGVILFDATPRVPLVSATWNEVAVQSPGRIDVMYDSGQVEHLDEDYREINAPVPAGLLPKAMEGMSRFYRK